jgi:hypothetical protein
MVYSLTSDNVMSPPKIKIEDTTKWVKKEETTIEQSVGIDRKWKWFSFNFLRKQANVNGNEQSVTEGTTVELTLGIDNINYYRRLEFWKIYIGHKRVESGEFIVKWMNAIYTKEEIAIDLKRGEFRIKLSEKKENEVLVHLKKKFENRLLTSEESDFIIKVDLTPQNQGPLEIPYSIQNCVVENENIVHYFTRIGRLNRFYEKKLFFRYRDDDTKELNYFIQLYANMDIYSICGLEFLENLKNNKGLPIFIKSTEDTERLYIEETPNELGTFLNSLTPELRLEMKDLKPEKFIIFPFIDKNIELIKKYKNYDFALVKNNLGQTEYILYHTPTSTSAEIGWASWRIIDIDFYNAVYRVIKTELYPNSISIKEYIKTRTKNNAVK